MAVKSITAWADDTEQTVFSGAGRVHCIEVVPNDAQAAEVYLIFWDVANPNPATTAEKMVIPIGTLAIEGGPLRHKIKFSPGIRFTTACTVFMATAYAGETAPTTTSLPQVTNIYYTVGN